MSLKEYQKLNETAKYAQKWPTIFHGLSVISNRISQPHIDNNGSWAWYDQILTIGTYKQATLVLEDFQARFDYRPGTVVQFCGNLLRHEVGKWDTGDRICYAYFVKKNLFDGLKISYPGWSYLDQLKRELKDLDI